MKVAVGASLPAKGYMYVNACHQPAKIPSNPLSNKKQVSCVEVFFYFRCRKGYMVQKVVIGIMLFCSSFSYADAQQLQPPSFYLSHPAVSPEARQYFESGMGTNDHADAYSILDSVFTTNDVTRPFYVLLVANMLEHARGELLIELSVVCKYLTELHPATVTEVLFSAQNPDAERHKDLWAERMSVETRISCSGELLSCFKQSRIDALDNCVASRKMKLEVLYNKVRKDLNLFQ